MGNAPAIILFWYFSLAVIVLMIALMFAAIVFLKKGKAQGAKQLQILGKMCLVLSMICSVPVVFVIGYILYLYMG